MVRLDLLLNGFPNTFGSGGLKWFARLAWTSIDSKYSEDCNIVWFRLLFVNMFTIQNSIKYRQLSLRAICLDTYR